MNNTPIKAFFSKLNPTDFLLIGYNIFIISLIIIFNSSIQSAISLLLTHIAIVGLIFVIKNLPDKFLNRLPVWLNLGILYPFLLLGFFYNETDIFNNIIFSNLDLTVSRFELILFGIQPALEFSRYFSSNIFAEFMYLGYFSYYLMIFTLPVIFLYERKVELAQLVTFIIMFSFVIYYVIFLFIPVTGPQYYFVNSTLALPEGYIFGRLIRTIQYLGEAPTAALPSSHVGICLIVIYLAAKYAPRLFVPLILSGILLIFSTVYIMAHYVVDVLAAFIITPIILYISQVLVSRLQLKHML